MMPSIVVMHASDVDPTATTRRGDENLLQFEDILVDELVPLIRQRYRVRADASSWAIAGVSLGGEFAVYTGLQHPELFASIGSISGSLVPRGDEEENLPSMDQRFGPALARPDVSTDYQLVWIGCGTSDNVCGGSRVFVERLQAAEVAHTWREYAGGHQMPVFRRELLDLPQVCSFSSRPPPERARRRRNSLKERIRAIGIAFRLTAIRGRAPAGPDRIADGLHEALCALR